LSVGPGAVGALLFCSGILGCVSAGIGRATTANSIPDSPWAVRYETRTFPSIFSAWTSAENLNRSPAGPIVPLSKLEKKAETLCRHDLIWNGPYYFGLRPNNAYAGLADGFIPDEAGRGVAARAELLQCNPHAITAVEIRYHDAPASYLPEDSPMWKRDEHGNRIIAWSEGGFYKLDYSNAELQDRAARQCLSAIQSGRVDGCFLDWWSSEDLDRLRIVKKIRSLIGEEAFIIVNSNGKIPIQSAPYINGIYMEGFGASFFKDWQVAKENLLWAKTALRAPAVTAFEGWFPLPGHGASLGRNDAQLMRFVTTLSLVFSDGTVLVGDANPLPTPDHLHDWYPFWSTRLGRPRTGINIKRSDGSYWRQFEGGVVVFNPPNNPKVRIDFADVKQSQASSKTARQHWVNAGDGDIFIP
jgi:hypothetical protein